jgi:hypothetical protein
LTGSTSRSTRRFVAGRTQVDAVIQRIGRETWDLLLIDQEGNWTREVMASEEECKAAAEEFGATVHVGWDDETIAKRMNRRDHWNDPGGQKRAL